MKKIFTCLSFIIFLSVFSYQYGNEYWSFHEQKKVYYEKQNILKKRLEEFGFEKIQEIEKISIHSTPNTDLLEEIEEKINNAKENIWLETYILTEKRIQKSLKNAYKRGVDVKVLLERNPYMAGHINKKAYDNLLKTGIDIQWSNAKNYALNHTKMLIIDDEIIISTGNFSYSSFTKNKDFFIFINDKNIHKTLSKVFINDFKGEKSIDYHNNLVISPLSSREKIEYLLKNAKKSIKIYIPYITDNHLETILQTQKEKDIKIIGDKKSMQRFQENNTQYAHLKIKTLQKNKMHSKAILIDEKILYIGSTNFSPYSLDKNREIGILIKNENIINIFKEEFKKDWQEN